MSIAIKPRDVVYQTARFEEPEVCPYYIWVDKAMVPPLAAHYGPECFIGPADGTRTFAGSYTAMTEILSLHAADQGDGFIDEFGAHIRYGKAAWYIQRPALTEPSLKNYTFPDLTTAEHFKHLDSWLETHAERFKIVQLGSMFWERTWFMRTMENILMDLILSPDFVDELLDRLEALCLGVIDHLLKNYGDRIDAIGFSEDYGTQRSLLISPEHWRRFIKPHLVRFAERIHRGGKRFYLHSCGHVQPIIPDLIEVGVDFLQPIQPEAMDILELKRSFGKDICLMGGISTQYTLQAGSVEDVRREVRTCLTHMAAGGGYVMAPAKAILPGVPIENAIALIDAFVNQNKL